MVWGMRHVYKNVNILAVSPRMTAGMEFQPKPSRKNLRGGDQTTQGIYLELSIQGGPLLQVRAPNPSTHCGVISQPELPI